MQTFFIFDYDVGGFTALDTNIKKKKFFSPNYQCCFNRTSTFKVHSLDTLISDVDE